MLAAEKGRRREERRDFSILILLTPARVEVEKDGTAVEFHVMRLCFNENSIVQYDWLILIGSLT